MSTKRQTPDVKSTKRNNYQPSITTTKVEEQLELLAEMIARQLVAHLKTHKK